MTEHQYAAEQTGKATRQPVATLFLDIDGVLVNRNSLRKASGLKATADPACVAELNRITDATGAKIVVSSTWRRGGRKFVMEKLRLWGVSGRIIGCTPILNAVDRGDEIQAYIDASTRPIGSFVILDDDSDAFHLSGRLVQTAFESGLTLADADRAIALLQETQST